MFSPACLMQRSGMFVDGAKTPRVGICAGVRENVENKLFSVTPWINWEVNPAFAGVLRHPRLAGEGR